MTSSSKAAFVSEKTHLLPKAKVKEKLDLLRMKQPSLLAFVKQKVSGSYHLTVFSLRQHFWEQCVTCTVELESFVFALFDKYTTILQDCQKGREKYALLQVHWMECLREIQFDPDSSSNTAVCWRELTAKAGGCTPSTNSSTILSCITQSVFTFCQQAIVAIKEEEECDTVEDVGPLQEAGLSGDEAALYRFGGFALYATLKAIDKSKPVVTFVLKGIQMTAAEIFDLPINIKHLDKGGMTFMKKECWDILHW